jgi:hypothetical protein
MIAAPTIELPINGIIVPCLKAILKELALSVNILLGHNTHAAKHLGSPITQQNRANSVSRRGERARGT